LNIVLLILRNIFLMADLAPGIWPGNADWTGLPDLDGVAVKQIFFPNGVCLPDGTGLQMGNGAFH
jgi:hypothetical protein